MSTAYTLWTEHAAQGPPFRAGRTSPLACCEWMRLLVGRSLALAQLRSSGPEGEEWVYLVLGVGVRHMRQVGDEEGLRLAADAVRRDFEQLRRSVTELKRRLNPQSPIEAPEAFLRSFDLVLGLRLPTDRSGWIVTDEGLTIVDWGLWRDSDRPLLEWTEEQLRAMEQQLTAELGTPRNGEPVRGGSTSAGIATAFRPARPPVARVEDAEPEPFWMDPYLAWVIAGLLLLTTIFFGWRCSVAAKGSSTSQQGQAAPAEASTEADGAGSTSGAAAAGAKPTETPVSAPAGESSPRAAPSSQPQPTPATDGGKSTP